MEEGTALVLALQLVALAAIAAALLLYLLCRLRRRRPLGLLADGPGGGRAVLVTSADSALGLQLALHLAQRGFRVFAGLREPEGGGASARALRAWRKAQEGRALAPAEGGGGGLGLEAGAAALEAEAALAALRLDVTREDLLHEAAGAVRSRLPAGQDGLWAVVNTAGSCARGRLEAQDSAVWEQLLRVNVVGALRAARALCPLLRSQKGGASSRRARRGRRRAPLIQRKAPPHCRRSTSRCCRRRRCERWRRRCWRSGPRTRTRCRRPRPPAPRPSASASRPAPPSCAQRSSRAAPEAAAPATNPSSRAARRQPPPRSTTHSTFRRLHAFGVRRTPSKTARRIPSGVEELLAV